jgi:hypothetical protein
MAKITNSILSDIFFGKGVLARRLDDAEAKYGNNESVAHIVAFCRPGNSMESS